MTADPDTLAKRIAELEEDVHEREDEALLVLTMGREMAADAAGTEHSEGWRECCRYYLGKYASVLGEEGGEP